MYARRQKPGEPVHSPAAVLTAAFLLQAGLEEAIMQDWGEEAAEGLVFQEAPETRNLTECGKGGGGKIMLPLHHAWHPVLLMMRSKGAMGGQVQAGVGPSMRLEEVLQDLRSHAARVS
jgi:hypothetical protein